jgi:hypothetical protein
MKTTSPYFSIISLMKKGIIFELIVTRNVNNVTCNDYFNVTHNNKNSSTMKYEITTCCQCGNEFKRTNQRQSYCSGACRVSAHRDRHGYEQPIFTYPTIRAIDNIKKIDIDALYNIQVLAIHYLLERQKKGEALPNDLEIKLMKTIIQIHTASEDDEINNVLEIVEPFSELLKLVKNIQKADKMSVD